MFKVVKKIKQITVPSILKCESWWLRRSEVKNPACVVKSAGSCGDKNPVSAAHVALHLEQTGEHFQARTSPTVMNTLKTVT